MKIMGEGPGGEYFEKTQQRWTDCVNSLQETVETVQ